MHSIVIDQGPGIRFNIVLSQDLVKIRRLRDFARSYDKTPYWNGVQTGSSGYLPWMECHSAWSHCTYRSVTRMYNWPWGTWSIPRCMDLWFPGRHPGYLSHTIAAPNSDHSRFLWRLHYSRRSHSLYEHNGLAPCAHTMLMSRALLCRRRMMRKIPRHRNIREQLKHQAVSNVIVITMSIK